MNDTQLNQLYHDLQENLFTASFNARYHDYLERRFVRCDLTARLLLAFAGVVVFACIKLVPKSDIWPTAAGAITLISTTVLPLFRWPKLIGAIESERARWVQLRIEYQNLWSDTKVNGDWDGAAKDFKKLRKRDNDFEKTGPLIPEHKDLKSKARNKTIEEFMPK